MRGNESLRAPVGQAAICVFPIPMRGNESGYDAALVRAVLVPDPHEG